MFAKLYTIEGKQYLAVRNGGNLNLEFKFEPIGGVLATMTLDFDDTDEGYEALNKAFDAVDEEKILKICQLK